MNFVSDAKRTIIFDFDGTIADTLETIAVLYNDIAEDFHCKKISFDQKERFRSMQTHEFLQTCGISLLKLPILALKIKNELNKEIKNIKPIDGIIEALYDLKQAEYKLGVLSSNSVANIKLFLNNHNLDNIFDFVHSGKNIFGKDKVILRLISKHKLNRSNVVYVGDETRDVEALRRIKVPIIAVSWGFNSKEVLEKLNPDFLVNKPEDLLKIVDSF